MTAPGPDPVADELLARAEAVVPPMSLDPAVVLERGRRRVRRRTVTTGAGGLLACAAVLAVVMGAVGHDAPSGFDAARAPSPSAATGTPSPTSAATTVPTPRTLAPGVVAPSGRLSADELGQVDLGTWEGVPVWLADGELHAQTDSDGAVSASRSTDDARAELLAPGRPSRGVYVWGTPRATTPEPFRTCGRRRNRPIQPARDRSSSRCRRSRSPAPPEAVRSGPSDCSART
ncbi:hypothetical protein GCM10025864_33110 [Luteimicrobium album]|uniref:Uncharacterized protein n=1 Tax=Luteimicrobium album TaxID=1054550 RepID=A0ABQ6I519_9MICO|nr:hypothetical protein [Luteimicrobium album]GMA25552.1 hypothetical protein GCM10025864_33110 [Luteimicrobium album]